MNIQGTQTAEETEVDVIEELIGGYALIIFNDDVNTFDHVIDCLVKYCEHTPEQAEQCALIIHFKGKCAVKHGSSTELKPICEALTQHGLSATLEMV